MTSIKWLVDLVRPIAPGAMWNRAGGGESGGPVADPATAIEAGNGRADRRWRPSKRFTRFVIIGGFYAGVFLAARAEAFEPFQEYHKGVGTSQDGAALKDTPVANAFGSGKGALA